MRSTMPLSHAHLHTTAHRPRHIRLSSPIIGLWLNMDKPRQNGAFEPQRDGEALPPHRQHLVQHGGAVEDDAAAAQRRNVHEAPQRTARLQRRLLDGRLRGSVEAGGRRRAHVAAQAAAVALRTPVGQSGAQAYITAAEQRTAR